MVNRFDNSILTESRKRVELDNPKDTFSECGVTYSKARPEALLGGPSVSIIVSDHYDDVSVTLRCLDSIYRQTLKDIEVIVITPSSDKRHQRSIESLPSGGCSTIIVERTSYSGSKADYAIGLEHASGRNIAFIDAMYGFSHADELRAIIPSASEHKVLVICEKPYFADADTLEALPDYRQASLDECNDNAISPEDLETPNCAFGTSGQQRISISVVVPIYNKQPTLRDCIESLINQTMDDGEYEIVLVDDGSSDDSLSICDEYVGVFPNLTIIHEENSGVSHARNAGIRKSRGEFIGFLDADDTLEPQSLEEIVRLFATLSNEVDIITYPITYWYLADNIRTGHKRDMWLQESGAYDLREYYCIAQTTMNIVIKRSAIWPYLFSEELEMGEDQLFITRHLARKSKIGFCKEARYVYRRNETGQSTLGNYPMFAFSNMISLFESYLDIAYSNDAMAKYAYQMILYNIGWRMESTMLLPDFGDESTRAANYQRLNAIIQQIPLEAFSESPHVDSYHKGYILQKFNRIASNPSVTFTETHTAIDLAPDCSWLIPIPEILFTEALQDEQGLHLSGHIMSAAFIFLDSPVVELSIGEKKSQIKVTPSSYDYHCSEYRTAKAWGISFTLPTNELEDDLTAELSICSEGKNIPSFLIQFPLLRQNCSYYEDPDPCWRFKNFTMTISEKSIHLQRRKPSTDEQNWPDDVSNRRSLIEQYRSEHDDATIWLYSDLPWSKSAGNALAQIRHDISVDDGIEKYYVTHFVAEVERNYPELKDHVVEFGSDLHLCLFATAQLILASYLEWTTFMPFHPNDLNTFGDLIRRQCRVYLQHGILHARLPIYLPYDRIAFDHAVVSTRFETNNLVDNYLFPIEGIIESGAPRLDHIKTRHGRTGRIIYIPSWRSYLASDKEIDRRSTFLESSFFRNCSNFIQLVEDSGILEKHDCTLEIKLHPNFNNYIDLFDVSSNRIMMADENVCVSDYDIAITDISSFVYDFVYAGSSILYFIPDQDELDAGMNHYNAIDLPYGDGFGPQCADPEEACRQLASLIERTVPEARLEEYARRRDDFFLYHDGMNRERLHEALVKLAI